MLKHLLAALAALLLATGAHADTANTVVGGYVIHHNAMTTDNLSPDIASAYGIQRSKERGMLNISVIRGEPGKMGKAVEADVKVTARNLIGQERDIDMREVREGDAIYYIGVFPVINREKVDFFMQVTPAGQHSPFKVQMQQVFYTD